MSLTQKSGKRGRFAKVSKGDQLTFNVAARMAYLVREALWEQVSTKPIVERIEPNSPYGAKEEGEGAIMPTIPAILNAVYDAIGISIHELPLTPERVFRAIQKNNRKNK